MGASWAAVAAKACARQHDVFIGAAGVDGQRTEDGQDLGGALRAGDVGDDAAALADGRGKLQRGGGIDGDLRGGPAFGGRTLLEDHGELLRQGGGVRHGDVDAVRRLLAELEGCVPGDHRVAERNRLVAGASHLNDGLSGGDDLPACGHAGGGALVGRGEGLQLDGRRRGGRRGLGGTAIGGEASEDDGGGEGHRQTTISARDEHEGSS